jgi:hypothetical protein
MTMHPIPDEALDEDIAILGRKGGGKSYTAKGIVERLLDMGRRVLVLDPLGVWAGLRTSADGERPGYGIAIFGGLHGDLPLEPAAAEPLARIIAAENLPAVIDLSELSKSAQQSFLLKFLHELRRANHEALTVVLEEADVFSPQQPQGDDSKALHAEIDWIARRGRFRGFRLLTITQRPARLSKDVLTQANMLIMHRLPSPQDQSAGLDWITSNGDLGKAKLVKDSLGSLKVGEAWVLAQQPHMLERTSFPRIKTLDTSATPKAGETRVEPKTLAQVDVSAIREALSQTGASNDEPKRDKVSKADLAAAEDHGYQRGLKEGRDIGYRQASHTAIVRVVDGLVGAAMLKGDGDALEAALATMRAWSPEDAPKARTAPPAVPATQVAPEPRKAPQRTPMAPRATSGTPAGHMKAGATLLGAIARYPDGISWADAAIVAGLMSGNGYFYGGKKYLISEGLVEERGDLVVARTITGTPAPLAEIVATWSAKLKKPGDQMLAKVAEAGSISQDHLAASLGIKTGNGYWYGGIKAMRSAGLTIDDKSGIRLSPLLAQARKDPTP